MQMNLPFQNVFVPLLGGVLIGFAALVLFALIGRIAGISGILGNIRFHKKLDAGWRLVFLIGLMGGGAVLFATHAVVFPAHYNLPPWKIIAAGLLVGFGTRLGSGCTSGHGVCGVARLSLRSIVATGVFILAGMIAVALFQ